MDGGKVRSCALVVVWYFGTKMKMYLANHDGEAQRLLRIAAVDAEGSFECFAADNGDRMQRDAVGKGRW